MTRAEILDEAKKCVCGQREEDYGSPEANFDVIGRLWETYLTYRCAPPGVGITIYPDDVATLMALFKIGRICTGRGTADSFVDLAGYAACAGELATAGGEA